MRSWVASGGFALCACGNVSSAVDAPPPKTVASLTVATSGTGMVVSQPAGIACPGTCTAEFPLGAAVTLTASSTAPISFAGWSDGCVPGRRECVLTLDADTTITATFAMAGAKRWLLTAGAASATTASNAHAMAARGGDVVVIGRVNGITNVGGMPTTSAGLLIARLDSDGNAKWVRSIPGPAALEGAVDAAGNVYVAGFFDITTDFGGGDVAPNAGSTDAFVAKYDPTGAYLWAKPLGGTFFDFATALALDPITGDVLVGGSFSRTVDFGGGDVTSTGGDTDDIYVARYAAATGAYVWARTFGNTESEQLYGLVVDGSGGVGLAGTYTGTMTMDGMILPGTTQSDAVFAKLAGDTGAVQFAKSLGGSASDSAHNIAVDRAGNWHVVGRYAAPVDLGGGPLPAAGQTFVAKFTPAGAHIWSRGFTGQTLRVAVDSFDDATIAGNFSGTLDLGGGHTLSSAGQSDAFVAKLGGADGAAIWAKRFGGAGTEQANGLAVDGLDRVYASGTFTGFAEFDDETPTSKGVNDLYVISLVP